MRKVREVMRLAWDAGLSMRQIARSCSISHSTVSELLDRARQAGLSWPLPLEWDDAALEDRLYTQHHQSQAEGRPLPDYQNLHRELRRKGVTLQLLWEEYRQAHPDGYQYSQFCERYRWWCQTIELSMRQVHRAGEKLFVDYAGQTIDVVERSTGEVRPAQLFVAALGCSNYTYAEASWSQELEAWISAHVRCFEFLGGAPAILVPDNLAAAVTRPCRYEPDINATYQEMAIHYGCAVIPARVAKARDKAKVENAVQQAERRILAPLRHHTFFSLTELNEAIAEAVEQLNGRSFQKLDGSRRSFFQTLDRPALRPLPRDRYVFARWKQARVNIDYHVELDRCYYSVPYQMVKQQVEVRLTATTVEILYRGKRVASHQRSYRPGQYTTLAEHRPASHRAYLEWTPSRLINWAETVGPGTAQVVKTIMERRPHPEQGYRSCLGVIRLARRYDPQRLEAACTRAAALGAFSYRSVNSILAKGLDRVALETSSPAPPVQHDHLRGAAYFAREGES